MFYTKKKKKVYKIRGCRTIDLQWYLGGGKLGFGKQSKNVTSVPLDSTKQVRLQHLLEVPTPATTVAPGRRWYASSKPCKPNSPTVQLWIGLTGHWHIPTLLGVQEKRSPQVTQNFVSRACKDHPPHHCSMSTYVATVYTPHHKRRSGC